MTWFRVDNRLVHGQVIEGNRGFKSDQDLKSPVFYGITGEIEVEQQSAPQRRERPQVD